MASRTPRAVVHRRIHSSTGTWSLRIRTSPRRAETSRRVRRPGAACQEEAHCRLPRGTRDGGPPVWRHRQLDRRTSKSAHFSHLRGATPGSIIRRRLYRIRRHLCSTLQQSITIKNQISTDQVTCLAFTVTFSSCLCHRLARPHGPRRRRHQLSVEVASSDSRKTWRIL
jgi:hypothetical protein